MDISKIKGQNRPTVFVVDDNSDFRDCILLLVEQLGYQAASFSTGREFLEFASPQHIGCIVLDFNLGNDNGLTILGELVKRGIQMPVIFTSGFLDVVTAVEAMKTGCFDVIEKGNEGLDRLLNSIQRAIIKELERHEADYKRDKVSSLKERLTPRESEVMELVVAGKRSKEIASILGISIGTVEIHRARVMKKMGAESVAELVRTILSLR